MSNYAVNIHEVRAELNAAVADWAARRPKVCQTVAILQDSVKRLMEQPVDESTTLVALSLAIIRSAHQFGADDVIADAMLIYMRACRKVSPMGQTTKVWTAPDLGRAELRMLDVAWHSPVLGYCLAERIEEGRRHNESVLRPEEHHYDREEHHVSDKAHAAVEMARRQALFGFKDYRIRCLGTCTT